MSSNSLRYAPLSPGCILKVAADLDLEEASNSKHGAKSDAPELSEVNIKKVWRHITSSLCSPIRFLERRDQVVVFWAYVGLFLCYSTWIHINQRYPYSAAMLTMSITTIKLLVSVIAFVLFDGTPKDLFSALSFNRRSLVFFIVPAFAYATTDSLGVYCYQKLDPATVVLLYHVRVVFLLLLFQHFMKISLRKSHWIAMGVVVLSCIIKELPHVLNPVESATDAMSGTSRIKAVFIVVAMAQLSAFAAVYNEKLLKEQPLNLNVQNIAMYSWSVLATFFFLVISSLFDPDRVFMGDLLDVDAWIDVWSYPMIVAILISAAYGLVTSYLMKSLNNLVRELACALQVVGALLINCILLGYLVQPTDVLATIGIVGAVLVYNRDPIK